jgi:site-specific DNA-cytosine methylase
MVTLNELFSGIGAFHKALHNLNIPHEVVPHSKVNTERILEAYGFLR